MKKFQIFIIILITIFFVMVFLTFDEDTINLQQRNGHVEFNIISSTENKDIEEILLEYAKENDINLKIEYGGTIEIMDKINSR